MSKDIVLIKDKECIHCNKFFDCMGKPKGTRDCVNYEERKKDNGRC